MNESSPTEEDILRIFLIAILKNCCKVFFGKIFFSQSSEKTQENSVSEVHPLAAAVPAQIFLQQQQQQQREEQQQHL